MFNCLQAEQTTATRKRKFLNRFSVINNVLEVFLNDMRYMNPRFTYLLTYLLLC